jgi:hypothetical protein
MFRNTHDAMRFLCSVLLLLGVPAMAHAQRDLYWARIDVDATLAADGRLRVSEMQTMVFTGEWNGGERRFNVRPRQRLALLEIARSEAGTWRPLTEDSDIDDRDDYAWTTPTTLRWRSREAGDPPFANTAIQYLIRYELANILLKDGDDYLLDHDFLFPDRTGPVSRFSLRLRLNPAWQAKSELRDEYTAEKVPPGRGFVLTVPLRYSGAAPLSTRNTRPPEFAAAVWTLLGIAAAAVGWLFIRENANGRFEPLPSQVDEAWVREHILKHPAEVVGAAWDEDIGASEVVALIARMVSEGKLESDVENSALVLNLKVDRRSLDGHERTLVERLFFDNRTTTSTAAVKQHYRDEGFDPAKEIKSELESAVEHVIPPGRPRVLTRFIATLFVLIGVSFLAADALAGYTSPPRAFVTGLVALLLIGFGWAMGVTFQSNLHWGRKQAIYALVPMMLVVGGVAAFLWFYVAPGEVDASTSYAAALVAFALAMTFASTTAMKSRRGRAALKFRKTLTAGREFFHAELGKEQPALRDQWYPWVLAFGLGKRADDWSAQRTAEESPSPSPRRTASRSFESGSSTSSTTQWTGFGGGRSGGAGAGASWATAASGLAAGVTPPSASGSGGGGSSSSGSSSSGSSGGGGGGGW